MIQGFYREIVLDHFQRPRNRRELEATNIEEHIDNPLCGDHVTVYAKVRDDVFEEVSFTGRGCSISQASASMLTEQLTGTNRDEAEGRVEAFLEMMRTEEKEELGSSPPSRASFRRPTASGAPPSPGRPCGALSPGCKHRLHRVLPRRGYRVGLGRTLCARPPLSALPPPGRSRQGSRGVARRSLGPLQPQAVTLSPICPPYPGA